jgi:hypothetical protein
MITYLIAISVLLVLAILWSIFSYLFERRIETPKYTTIERKDGYEIREYEPYLIAQVEVAGTYAEASSQGFRILADYIFGNNTMRDKLSMTAPVTESGRDRAHGNAVMAMTAPVSERESTDGTFHVIAFVMPSKYSIKTLPKPNNPEIKIVAMPKRKMAVLKFSWYANGERAEQKKQDLLMKLKTDGMVSLSDPKVARYNAPFSAPWLNRNEILAEVRSR